jgi:hypothetical protein
MVLRHRDNFNLLQVQINLNQFKLSLRIGSNLCVFGTQKELRVAAQVLEPMTFNVSCDEPSGGAWQLRYQRFMYVANWE